MFGSKPCSYEPDAWSTYHTVVLSGENTRGGAGVRGCEATPRKLTDSLICRSVAGMDIRFGGKLKMRAGSDDVGWGVGLWAVEGG